MVALPQMPRALVVDDEPGPSAELSGALAAHGIEARMAWDRTSALQVLTDSIGPIDVIVVDLCMPGGEALVQTVRTMGGERDLPIVALVGSAESGDPQLRMNRSVRKCEGPEHVAEVVAALVGLARHAAEAAARAAEAAALAADAAARTTASEEGSAGRALGKITLARRLREA